MAGEDVVADDVQLETP
jgi:hypothetical protein